jgi:hypothetical protein
VLKLRDVSSTVDPWRIDCLVNGTKLGDIYLFGMGAMAKKKAYKKDRKIDVSRAYYHLYNGPEHEKELRESLSLRCINLRTNASDLSVNPCDYEIQLEWFTY